MKKLIIRVLIGLFVLVFLGYAGVHRVFKDTRD